MDVQSILDDPVLMVGSALLGFVVIFVVMQLFSSKSTASKTSEPAAELSRSAPVAASGGSKKKNKKKKKAAPEPEKKVEEKKEERVAAEPPPQATSSSKGKKKKNKKAAAATPEATKEAEKQTNGDAKKKEATPPPDPTPVVEEKKATSAAAAAGGGKKKKKNKNKKQVSPAPAPASAAPAEEEEVAQEDSDDDDDDDIALLATFAKGGRGQGMKAQSSKKADNNNNNKPPGEWKTISKKSKAAAAAAPAADVAESEAPTTGATESLSLEPQQVPLLLGPKGATIQQIQAQTGAKLDVDKAASKVAVSGTPTQVFAAVREIQTLLDDAAKQGAHTVTLSGAEINGADGVKAIVGRGGSSIQKLEALCPDCRIKANIELGTVTISGPTEDAVAAATRHCKNAVWGESNMTLELESRAMVLAICGRTFADLQQYQKDTNTRMDVTGTTLTIRGDTDKVQSAYALLQQKVALYQGVTIDLEAAQIGAIIGQGGANLRKIQERSGAQVEVNQNGDRAECKIIGDPKAVQAARVLVEKTLSGEVELKPGEGRMTVELGVGASAVIGRGGSNIAELEKKYGVKLNVQNAVCSIVGKKEKLSDAKAAIEEIVKPLIQKAAEEAKIREQAEAMAASGNNAWGMPENDELAGW